MNNLPPGPYSDNIIELAGRDRPKALSATELAAGIYAPRVISTDAATGLPLASAGAKGGANGSSYQDGRTSVPDPRLLHSTSAVAVAAGVIGASGGVANDSQLVSVVILKNAGPATLTVGGFMGEDGSARNMVFTGSTSADTVLPLAGLGLQNSGGPMAVTASVADVILVGVRSSGPSLGRLPTGIAVIAGNAPNVNGGPIVTPSVVLRRSAG